MIDSHCHLTDPKFGDELNGVMERARAAGVKEIIVPASGRKDWERIEELINKYDGVYGCLGVHPEEADGVERGEELREELREAVKKARMVGIGEIGMDGYWNKRNLFKQAGVFKVQMELAAEINLPVVIHSRGAGEEIKTVMERLKELPRGQFHCFGEDEEFLKYVLDRGYYVSFAGNVTYKNAERLRELAKRVPRERLLLETDAPYLAPESKRGSRNEPVNVRIIGEFLADYLGIAAEELFWQTERNTRELFKL